MLFLFTEFTDSSTLEEKVTGGEELTPQEAKFLASITYKDVHRFSGFLISKKNVLTTAYNLQNFWLDPIIPYFGDYRVLIGCIVESIERKKHLMEQVQAYKYYPYQDKTYSHNVAIITVDIAFFSKYKRIKRT